MSDLECVAVHVHKQTLLTITNVNFASKKIFVTDETFLLSQDILLKLVCNLQPKNN
jgi:hypothetical protein